MNRRWLILLVFLAGCHWCQDETNMFILSVTGGSGIIAYLRARWHHFRHHKDCAKSPSISEDSEV